MVDPQTKILFYSPGFKTKRASHRLRGEITANELRKLGLDAKATRSLDTVDNNTIVVFLKLTQPQEIQQAKDQGALTIYDLCDNKFDEREEFLPCCQLADIVTCNSEQMAISVKENTGRDGMVIPDPAERPLLPAKFSPDKQIKLLWFGSSASLKFVPWVDLWQQLESQIVHFRFDIITAKPDRMKNKMLSRQQSGVIKNVDFNKIQWHEWSWELQGQLLADTDLVLIPVVTDNYRTDTKSANRLIDSLMSGKFVITTPLASYVEFEQFTWQQDMINGIQWAQNHPERVILKVSQGQEHVVKNYSPEVIAKQWLKVFENGKS